MTGYPPAFCHVAPAIRRYPFISLGEERHYDSQMTCPRTQCSAQPAGLEPGPHDPESSTLTIRPTRLLKSLHILVSRQSKFVTSFLLSTLSGTAAGEFKKNQIWLFNKITIFILSSFLFPGTTVYTDYIHFHFFGFERIRIPFPEPCAVLVHPSRAPATCTSRLPAEHCVLGHQTIPLVCMIV